MADLYQESNQIKITSGTKGIFDTTLLYFMQITQPKLKNIFSQQEENNLFVPENSNFLEVHDVSKIVAESIRHSYLVKDVKSSDL